MAEYKISDRALAVLREQNAQIQLAQAVFNSSCQAIIAQLDIPVGVKLRLDIDKGVFLQEETSQSEPKN